jgi:hypothetical protein
MLMDEIQGWNWAYAAIALRQGDGCIACFRFCALRRCMKGSIDQNRKHLNFPCY